MASILKKPWKEAKKKTASSPFSLERKMEIKEAKKAKTEALRQIASEIKQNKREFFEMKKKKLEEKKLAKKNKKRV
ncbi:hypothetical protein ENBRE01_1715 [Enteropsectra breve]|nr:hypothetical protein ENBRE01_1013 [Enteropsectra breve]KAI5150799.1 hypothetical protein ENBRE01_1715 [Enteropsectra breve]